MAFTPGQWGTIAGGAANVGGAYARPTMQQQMQGATPYELPDQPGILDKGKTAGMMAGETALNFVPVVGSALSTAAGAIRQRAQENAAERYQKRAAGANPLVQKGQIKSTYVPETKTAKLKRYAGSSAMSSPVSGAATGAGIGTAVMPGIGTAVGAGIGAIAGYFGKKRAKREAEERAKKVKQIVTQNQTRLGQAAQERATTENAKRRGAQPPTRLGAAADSLGGQPLVLGLGMRRAGGAPTPPPNIPPTRFAPTSPGETRWPY